MSWKKGDLGKSVNVMFGGPRPLPVWPWKRDALAQKIQECRAECARHNWDRETLARKVEKLRSESLADKSGDAGGIRRVYVRACARHMGVTECEFILGAISRAVSLVAQGADGLPLTRRELCAVAAAEIDGAFDGRDRTGTLAGLVWGGVK